MGITEAEKTSQSVPNLKKGRTGKKDGLKSSAGAASGHTVAMKRFIGHNRVTGHPLRSRLNQAETKIKAYTAEVVHNRGLRGNA